MSTPHDGLPVPPPLTVPPAVPVSTAVPVSPAVSVQSAPPAVDATLPGLEPAVETADEVVALVLSVPGVAGLHGGRFGEVATYLPGRRVTGVKLDDELLEVHVVLRFDAPLRAVAQQIHAVLATVVAVPVQVFVEDLAAPDAA